MKEMLLPIILLMYCHIGITNAYTSKSFIENNQKTLLNNQQIHILDILAAKELPTCSFVFKKVPVNTVTANDIFECVNALHNWLGAKIEFIRLLNNRKFYYVHILDLLRKS
jgi:hypothetical protein